MVSVPFRGFRGLQEEMATLNASVGGMFQSPSGVLGVCRELKANGHEQLIPSAFQSPSGVLGVCRLETGRLLSPWRSFVSVPFRGFRGLQAEEHPTTLPSKCNRFSPLPGF